jgi:hypothetical protein
MKVGTGCKCFRLVWGAEIACGRLEVGVVGVEECADTAVVYLAEQILVVRR